METAPSFASAQEAAEVVRAGLGYLAAADPTAMTAGTQARCLQILEQATAMGTAARASILAAFTAGQGYTADADYSPRAWLINKTRVTKGTAVAYTAWVRRAAGRGASRGRGGAGGRGDIGVVRPDDLHLDRQAAAGLPGGCGRRWQRSGRRGSGRSGPGTGRRPRPAAATAARGWTATPPGPSPATRRWPRS